MRAFPILLLAALTALPAQAAIVAYRFTATVNTVVESPASATTGVFVDSSSMAGPTLSLGDTWTGTLFYDTSLQLSPVQPEQPANSSFHRFEGYIASTIVDVNTGLSFGSNLAGPNMPSMFIEDAPVGGYDSLVIFTYASGTDMESSSFMFGDADGSGLSSATPPPSLDLAEFSYSTVYYHFSDAAGNHLSAGGTITSLTVSDLPPPVPEPATYAMLGLGLAALAMTRKPGSET